LYITFFFLDAVEKIIEKCLLNTIDWLKNLLIQSAVKIPVIHYKWISNDHTSICIYYIWTETSRANDLEDQIRIFKKEKKGNLSELQDILNILYFCPDSCFLGQLGKMLLILNFSQDSFHLELLIRILFLSSRKESCLNIMTKKNLVR